MSAEQGSPEWLLERSGHCSASRFHDVIAKIKSGAPAAGRKNYRALIVVERLTGQPVPTYHNAAMQWGNDVEPEARRWVEAESGMLVEKVGFVKHPDIEWVGASPDGLLGDDGGVEIKCPYESSNHIALLRWGMQDEHRAQVQGNMWVTGRKWWYLASFDPRMPDHLKLYITKIKRDDEYIAKLELEVRSFLKEVAEEEAFLRGWKRLAIG
jgi:putative phage-type endonuclease